MDDMYIAQIGLDQKQAVVQTQNDWSVAKMENAKAEADFNEMNGSKLSIVKNEHQAAKLQINSAIENKKAAEASADTNRINQAQVELRTAETGAKAADSKVKYYASYRDYLKVQWRLTQENMYWREAQYELAKSQLAQKNNIAPKGVNLTSFAGQEQERGRRTQGAKGKVDAAKQRAQGARENWLRDQTAAGKPAEGDPMGAPGPASTLGS